MRGRKVLVSLYSACRHRAFQNRISVRLPTPSAGSGSWRSCVARCASGDSARAPRQRTVIGSWRTSGFTGAAIRASLVLTPCETFCRISPWIGASRRARKTRRWPHWFSVRACTEASAPAGGWRHARAPVEIRAGCAIGARGEVRAATASWQPQLCALLMYGSGLRLTECVSLRIKDIDLDRGEIVVRQGKGGKDRRTPLAEVARPYLARRLRDGLRSFQSDHRLDVRVTGIADSYLRKDPKADAMWSWWYVFPATRTFVDANGTRRRHHLHATVVQRAFKEAVRTSTLRSAPRVTAFATRSRRTFWSRAPTSEPCRSCLATRT